jgi:hypothetical protein
MRSPFIRKLMLPAATVAALAVPVLLPGVASAHTQSYGTQDDHHSRNQDFASKLSPVPTNRVHGMGNAKIELNGNTARVSVDVRGLLNSAPHAMHIHIKGEGECPQADDASQHNGHLSMSTTDGLDDYGPIGTSLTTRGDTSPASALAVTRFPSTGTFHYTRTIRVTDAVARAIRHDNAVVVVHGIDYNGNGQYDAVLGASDLDPSLPQEATAPALCGPLDD